MSQVHGLNRRHHGKIPLSCDATVSRTRVPANGNTYVYRLQLLIQTMAKAPIMLELPRNMSQNFVQGTNTVSIQSSHHNKAFIGVDQFLMKKFTLTGEWNMSKRARVGGFVNIFHLSNVSAITSASRITTQFLDCGEPSFVDEKSQIPKDPARRLVDRPNCPRTVSYTPQTCSSSEITKFIQAKDSAIESLINGDGMRHFAKYFVDGNDWEVVQRNYLQILAALCGSYVTKLGGSFTEIIYECLSANVPGCGDEDVISVNKYRTGNIKLYICPAFFDDSKHPKIDHSHSRRSLIVHEISHMANVVGTIDRNGSRTCATAVQYPWYRDTVKDNAYSYQFALEDRCPDCPRDICPVGHGDLRRLKMVDFLIVFRTKPNGNDYADCDGLYTHHASDTLYGKPVYDNLAKSRFLAWNGYSWAITGRQYRSAIMSGSIGRGFGGFHFSTNGNQDIIDSLWGNYFLNLGSQTVSLVTKPGASNYANCDGDYDRDDSSVVNSLPIYVNVQKSRFVAWNGYSWTLTADQYKDWIVNNNVWGFGGFHFSRNGNVDLAASTWNQYFVRT